LHANQRGKTTSPPTLRGVCSEVPSNTTARVHESMRDAELHRSEDLGAIGAIGVFGAIGANNLQQQVVEAGAG
jgi:hypothetical protein